MTRNETYRKRIYSKHFTVTTEEKDEQNTPLFGRQSDVANSICNYQSWGNIEENEK